jgi:hypothetical protein
VGVQYRLQAWGWVLAAVVLVLLAGYALVASRAAGRLVGTLWSGSAAAGRRIARLAAISAGLYIFLYGTIAVAVLGAAGTPVDTNWTVNAIVDDRLSTNVTFYLWFLPLTTAAIAWAAAAAAVRLHPRLATAVSIPPLVAAGLAAEGTLSPMTPPEQAAQSVRVRNGRRTARLALICAAVAAILILSVGGWLISGR